MRRMLPIALLVLFVTATAAAAAHAQPEAGPFAKGRKRVGLYAGAGSGFGNNYFIVGGGLGYFVAPGLEAGVDYEAWIGDDPSTQKVTPQLRYVFWKADPVKPYLGAFWRHTWLGGGWPDYDSWGGRLGIAYRSGGNYLAVGVVHERYLDNDSIDFDGDSDTYPEVAFWFSF